MGAAVAVANRVQLRWATEWKKRTLAWLLVAMVNSWRAVLDGTGALVRLLVAVTVSVRRTV